MMNMIERPIAKGGGTRGLVDQELPTRAALGAALDRLGLVNGQRVPVAVTIGFANCGVGSGPDLRGWLEEMSEELGEPIIFTGDHGISYAPTQCVEFAERLFGHAGLQLLAVELAPVAAGRVVGRLSSAAMTLGSGVAWSARILHDQVMEAFESDGPFDEAVHVSANGVSGPLGALAGVAVEENLCRIRRVSVAALGPAVGAALSLLRESPTNLLQGEATFGPVGLHGGEERAHESFHENGSMGVAPATDLLPHEAEGRGSEARPDDTHQLRRRPEVIASHREGSPSPGNHRVDDFDDDPLDGDFLSPGHDDLAGIEAFAHPDDLPQHGFSTRDFLLGALGMLILVILLWLIVL
ncbi:MAG: hypothetical protein GY773_27065 [Actinomycetia bacterium]|nr:hypothetical protein [Actinomycetes bacterium]